MHCLHKSRLTGDHQLLDAELLVLHLADGQELLRVLALTLMDHSMLMVSSTVVTSMQVQLGNAAMVVL